jgi:hypothetical protein
MSEHTPGPWTVRDHRHENGHETYRIEHGDDGEIVCLLETDHRPNADLIAAAPDAARKMEERDVHQNRDA